MKELKLPFDETEVSCDNGNMLSHAHRSGGARLALLGCLSLLALAGAQADQKLNRVAVIRVAGERVPADVKVVKAQIAGDGTIHILLNTADGPSYVKSSDLGAIFSAPLSIVDSASKKPGLQFQGEDLAVSKEGRVHVALSNNAWKLKLPEEEWGFYYASLAPGAKQFAPVRNVNRKPSEGFSLAVNEQGNITACFLSGKLYTMTSRDHGATFSAYAEANPAWDPCNCCTTAATYGQDGQFALLYREETDNNRDMYVVLQQGESKPSRFRISETSWKLNACPMTYFTINRTDRGYVAAWPTQGRVYFSRFDQAGSVLPPGEIKTPGTSGMRNGLVALSASDGLTLIAWKNKDVLGWQLYDAKGQAQGDIGSAPSPGGGAAGVVLPNGRFLVFP